jgi:chromosome segregation protein
VYLKTLTLRGFKSFASATTLRFEPGITCVVGPNGSGKSNVVDAFSWVMGEQGVKPLRGGKMEDVVFAGTAGRPALGRAQVTLTIDNSDGALPIEYAEVTISRLLFRSGQSEYAINGDHCRLLDVQELLSDTGLGREMHVIVGQGHLDEVLNAGPEARRALIEEAAGVLKHRRRKEKALRKLESMQANLTRLVDLTSELGRRLKPLGRQAQIARRAAVIQADLRDARLRLLADDYLMLAGELQQDERDEAAAAARRAELEAALAAAHASEAELEEAERLHAPRLAAAQQTFFALAGLAERVRGTGGLAQERHRHLSAPPEPQRPGRDPDELDREAAGLREQETQLGSRLASARAQLTAAVTARTATEAAVAETERQMAADARAAAQRAEQLGRLRSQVESARSRLAAGREEAGRLADALAQARTRSERAQHEYGALQDQVAGREQGRADLAAARERAAEALAGASGLVTRRRSAEHQASDQRAALRARVEALREAARSADGSGALLAGQDAFPGVLGPLASLLTVEEGAADAITAALGAAAGAVAVSGVDTALAVIESLKSREAGRAELVIAAGRPAAEAGSDGRALADGLADADGGRAAADGGAGSAGRAGADGGARAVAAAGRVGGQDAELPPGVARAADLVKAPGELAAAVDRLLASVLVVPDLRAGLGLISADPRLLLVTRSGDLIGAHWARGGSPAGQSMLSLREAAEQAAGELAGADSRCERTERDLADAAEDEEAARQALAEATADLQQLDAAAAETSGKLGALAGAARAARDEAGRLAAAAEAAERTRDTDLARLAQLQGRLAVAEAEGKDGADGTAAITGQAGPTAEAGPAGTVSGDAGPAGTGTGEAGPAAARAGKEALDDAAVAARSAEMEARLEVRTAEERLRAISGRADALAAAAVAERQAARRATERAARRAAQAAVAGAAAAGAAVLLAAIEQSRAVADAEREAAELASTSRGGELKKVRDAARELTQDLDQVVDSAHGTEIARAGRRLRLEQIAARATEEFAVDADVLVAEYGPEVLIPPAEEGQQPAAYDRVAQERRAQAAQRQLDQLGKVNPLALEEFAALEERHAFLVNQLEDLKKTRRDLLTVIKEVDDRVQQVFASAFQDTAIEFERIFGRLFPGGAGSLVLTEPNDLLATGIDIEARPPGKKVKRLSLLSGGERALTAIAFLIAIFRARPSPFYVLDEVEAALDDANLQRLLEIFAELRDSSQLIIVTHQKRTMEIADSLYGISMRGDGVSAVISQRLRERETV